MAALATVAAVVSWNIGLKQPVRVRIPGPDLAESAHASQLLTEKFGQETCNC